MIMVEEHSVELRSCNNHDNDAENYRINNANAKKNAPSEKTSQRPIHSFH